MALSWGIGYAALGVCLAVWPVIWFANVAPLWNVMVLIAVVATSDCAGHDVAPALSFGWTAWWLALVTSITGFTLTAKRRIVRPEPPGDDQASTSDSDSEAE